MRQILGFTGDGIEF
jgi:hypothetical protein